MQFSELAGFLSATVLQQKKDRPVETLLTDSRQAVVGEGSLFFAMKGERHDGHIFLKELYQAGIRQFVVEIEVDVNGFPEANILRVDSSLEALQRIARQHREKFSIPVVGITGSNGKTIVKEWLFQALAPDFQIVRNPGSYNSQIGVPLSVWMMQPFHQLAIFEAGISQPGEMRKLQSIIQPTIGIFTNLGSAHDEGFRDRKQKCEEKAQLFKGVSKVIYCKDHNLIDEVVRAKDIPALTWGKHVASDILIKETSETINITHAGNTFQLTLPWHDEASKENVFHVMAFLLLQGYPPAVIKERLAALQPVPMRLELKQGINRCLLVDDSYNNDLAGLQISLNFLRTQRKAKRTLILSDILQSGLSDAVLADRFVELIAAAGIQRFIAIGPALAANRAKFPEGLFYPNPESFLAELPALTFADEAILIKGARPFRFERIVERLQRKVHRTRMEVDLTAMVNNLNLFRRKLKPGVKVMAMVKAFAYGSGSEEVASLLQYHRVDYLGVAYADEGMDLRKNNITTPIMVMNPSEEGYQALLDFHLEPEIFSEGMLKSLVDFLDGRECSVHLKLDTGMHRLGFDEAELPKTLELLQTHRNLKVVSAFSHLAGADSPEHDAFSREQVSRFNRMASLIEKVLGYRPLLHLLNSPGILRFPDFQYDMVRLGIGLYGIDPTFEGTQKLMPVATLKSIISQIKKIPAGDTIGYGRRGRAEKDMTLATIAIGYADGYSRSFSQGKGKVQVGGKLAPVIGNVCMDMTMIDISGIPAKEGDEVVIFGPQLPIEQVASWIDTIPYELLASTSERVKRVFHTESV